MSMLFSLLMKADAGQAKAELRALSGEVAKGKTEVAALGNAAAVADTKVDALGDASARAAAQNEKLSQSQTRVGTSAGAAAGSVGYLVAQFNDIGMMISAGQSPLQLAIQQGTQITQVIGPMGAAGAVKALGGAFLSALSPINMITLGIIGFGAAAIQALLGGEEATKSLVEVLEEAGAALDELKAISRVTRDDLRSDFGAVTADIIEMQAALGKLATVRAFQAQRDALMALKAETEGSWFAAFTSDRFTQGGQISELLGSDWLVKGKLVATDEVDAFRDTLDRLESARGPQAQLEIFRSLREQIEASTGGIDQMTTRQMAYYEGLLSAESQLRQAMAARSEMFMAPAKEAIGNVIDRGVELAETAELLRSLQQQAELQQLINQHGRDSEIVALARAEAERAAFEQMVESLRVSEGLKAELMSAWDAANGLASARIGAMIESALGPASALNGLLKSAAGWWATIKSNMAIARFNRDSLAASKTYSGRGGDPRDFMPGGKEDDHGRFVYDGPALDRFNNPVVSGGAKAAREERDAVAELIQKLREEQEVLAETDPVKREMLKHRKDLAKASAAERAEVEGLIRAEMQLKAVQQARDYATDAVGDFLDQIIAKGGKASDVLKGLAAQFLSMAARSVLTGSGWFANILGLSGGIFAGAQARAGGGMIYGEGGPRDDRVPVWASAGEFMVNARATARYRPVLERINSGAGLPGFANGGMIGGSALGGGGNRAGEAPSFTIHVQGATGNDEIRKLTAEGVRAGLKHYDTYVLPGRVDQIQRLPRDR